MRLHERFKNMKNNESKIPDQEKPVLHRSLGDLVIARRKVVQDYSRVFLSTFGVQLGRYMHPLFGFDVVRFDQMIQPKDGESTKDKVEREYGQEAVDLIMELIKA